MWLRYLGISIVKWICVFFVITVFTTFIAPSWLRGFWLSIPIWILIFFCAYGFAYWALHIQLPVKREIITLIVVWVAVTICLELFYEILAVGQPIFLLYSPDLYAQYLFEIAAIVMASYVIRKNKLRAATGEGMVV